MGYIILLLPSTKCTRALFSVFLVFIFDEVAVGVGASVDRDQSAPAQTAPQQAGLGSQTERLLFFLGEPRTKRLRCALARLIANTATIVRDGGVYQESSTITNHVKNKRGVYYIGAAEVFFFCEVVSPGCKRG